jgi:hypothetical protein
MKKNSCEEHTWTYTHTATHEEGGYQFFAYLEPHPRRIKRVGHETLATEQ